MNLQWKLLPFLIAVAAIADAGDDLPLYRKATVFEADMEERFLVNNQIAPKLKLPTNDRTFVAYNMPDNAYMTGLYCAAQSWRYAITGDPNAKRLARTAFHGMNHLLEVTGEPGLLARASMPVDMPWEDDGEWKLSTDGKFRWRGDVSSDQVDGVIFGYYVYFTTACSEEEEPLVAEKVDQLVSRIVDAGLRILDENGEVTTWGHYEPEYVGRREPMNALLMLQMLKVAHYVTGKQRFADEYRRLIEEEGYAELATRARRAAPPERVNHSDDVLIEIALQPLMELEKDPAILEKYRLAIDRWWNGADGFPGVSVEANPLATFFYSRWTGDESFNAAAAEALRRLPLDMKWNRDTIARYEKRFGFTFEPETDQSPLAPDQPVPVHRRGKTWSYLVDNPYGDEGDRSVSSGLEYQGLDYTLPYWFGLAHGMIEEDAVRTPADIRRSRIGDSPREGSQ